MLWKERVDALSQASIARNVAYYHLQRVRTALQAAPYNAHTEPLLRDAEVVYAAAQKAFEDVSKLCATSREQELGVR